MEGLWSISTGIWNINVLEKGELGLDPSQRWKVDSYGSALLSK
jgi:hypothetical protein